MDGGCWCVGVVVSSGRVRPACPLLCYSQLFHQRRARKHQVNDFSGLLILLCVSEGRGCGSIRLWAEHEAVSSEGQTVAVDQILLFISAQCRRLLLV